MCPRCRRLLSRPITDDSLYQTDQHHSHDGLGNAARSYHAAHNQPDGIAVSYSVFHIRWRSAGICEKKVPKIKIVISPRILTQTPSVQMNF
jgi:hypothetical protein